MYVYIHIRINCFCNCVNTYTICMAKKRHGFVSQYLFPSGAMVARLTSNQKAAGSSPVLGIIFNFC